MVTIAILVGSGLICVLGILLFIYLSLKYKNEDFCVAFVFGIMICIGGSAWCVTECVKRADIYDKANK